MSFVFSIILLLLLIFARLLLKKHKIKGFSLCTVFVLFWAIILFFRGFHFYRLYECSVSIYFYVFIGSLSLVLGYLFFQNCSYLVNYHKLRGLNQRQCVLHLRFNVFYYCVLLFAIYIVVKQILVLLPIILASGVAGARTEAQLDNLFLEGDWAILISYFARPFIKASLIIMVVNLFRHRLSVKEIILLIIVLFVAFVSEGGRLLIMDVFFAFIYMLFTNKALMKRKSKHVLYGAIVFIGCSALISTLERGSSILEDFYIYYCAGLNFFDQAIKYQSTLFDPSLYGMNCYQGLFKPLWGILNYMGIPKPENLVLADNFILDCQSSQFDVGANLKINYYVTAFGYAYRDGGPLFIFIDFFLYGVLCCWADLKEFFNWGDIRWTAIKVVFFYTMLYTMAAFPFATYMPVMTLIYIYIITSKLFSKRELQNI